MSKKAQEPGPACRLVRLPAASGPASSTLLVLSLLGASVLAGCTDPSGREGAPEPIAARQAVQTSLEAARAWQPDAEVVILSGIEASEGSLATREVPGEEGRSQPRTWVDPQVGDGRAPSWTVMVWSQAANATRTYQVTARGAESMGTDEGLSGTPTPLGNWTVGSEQAVGIALGNASFREAALASDGTVVLTLGTEGSRPVWTIVGRSHAEGAHAQVRIDARNGTVLGPR